MTFSVMNDELQWLEMELTFVRSVRKTRNPDLLGVVRFAAEREQAILARIAELNTAAELPLAAETAPIYRTGTGGEG